MQTVGAKSKQGAVAEAVLKSRVSQQIDVACSTSRKLKTIIPKAATINEVFPTTYKRAYQQAAAATKAAIADGHKLLEVEFPPVKLRVHPSEIDTENTFNLNLGHLRKYADCCAEQEIFSQDEHLRIFLPDEQEVRIARQGEGPPEQKRQGAFRQSAYTLDYLTQPKFWWNLGFGLGLVGNPPPGERVTSNDQMLVAGYAGYNLEEYVHCERLWKETAEQQGLPLVVFNSQLYQIRCGYYSTFMYPRMQKLGREFLPNLTQAYYLGIVQANYCRGAVFRAYPGPWQVFLFDRNNPDFLELVHTQAEPISEMEAMERYLNQHSDRR